ncbi:MAG: hypothetical protein R3336_05490, partial [Phycisphaeraceae bacterium]|nr:hypothetical protein [Phycisphaeraceae bacterium]
EMLVAIAIASTTAALVLPAMVNARESVYQVMCMNHLRQNGLYTEQYINDNNGQLPSFFLQMAASGENAWMVQSQPLSKESAGLNHFDADVLADPSDIDPSPAQMVSADGTVNNVNTGYSYNIDLLLCNKRYWEINKTVNYSELVVMYDGGMGSDINGAYFGGSDFAQRTAEYRHLHGNEASVLFADWHVGTTDDIQAGFANLCGSQGGGDTVAGSDSGAGGNGNGNNGHGNNLDGVDSSNPGNAPFEDSDPDVDDEANGGGGAGGNGNGNGNGN